MGEARMPPGCGGVMIALSTGVPLPDNGLGSTVTGVGFASASPPRSIGIGGGVSDCSAGRLFAVIVVSFGATSALVLNNGQRISSEGVFGFSSNWLSTV